MAEISKTEIGFELRKRNCPPNLQPVSDKCRHGLYGLKNRKPRADVTVRGRCKDCTSKSKRTPQNLESDRKVKCFFRIPIIAFSAYSFCKITRFEFLVYVKYRVLKKFCLSLS